MPPTPSAHTLHSIAPVRTAQLRYILHDWDSASVDTILKNIRAAMGNSSSTLVVGECAMPDRDTLSPVAPVYGIDMQMMAIFGDARER